MTIKLKKSSVLAFLFAAAGFAFLFLAGDSSLLLSQAPAKVDFGRDVLPLLRENCTRCHGPSQQMGEYRLDRRAAAGIGTRTILPGNSQNSRLYLRLIGSEFGAQMPPTGALGSEQIAVLKAWIDQGAEWPDEYANDAELPGEDALAAGMIDAIRKGDARSLDQQLQRNPDAVNRRGPGGSTPLMYAALYGDARLVSRFLKAGADPNIANNAGATALMWALDDFEKSRLLLDHGADVNVRSGIGRTPLLIAAGQTGAAKVVQLLIERGANLNPPAPLAGAAARGDSGIVRLLLEHGMKDTGAAATASLRSRCSECFKAVIASGAIPPLRNALITLLPPSGHGYAEALSLALGLGADAKAKDSKGQTVLMLAAASDAISGDSIKALLDHGADVNATAPGGETALDFARRTGETRVVDVLLQAGARGKSDPAPELRYVNNNTIASAVARSMPVLQKSALQFVKKSGCVSCHHNSLTERTVATARKKGFAVDANLDQQEMQAVTAVIDANREQLLQGVMSLGGGATTLGYILIAFDAHNRPPSQATDAMVRHLKLTQQPDGRWTSVHRPPSESSEFTAAAVSLRGLQLYAPKGAGYDRAMHAAAEWLTNARPATTEDRVFRVFGLTWSRASKGVLQSAVQELIREQRSDGAWAQLPTLKSDAYATGSALVALNEAGVPVKDPVYQRGLRFLLNTQLEDGSWLVRTRSRPVQPYFESGFPHGIHQWIPRTQLTGL